MPRKRKTYLRFRLIVAEEYQPLEAMPKTLLLSIWATILVFLSLQVWVRLNTPPPTASAISLPSPPNDIAMHALSVGDPVTLGKATNLWLQAFDNQQGESISFHQLDYNIVAAWLQSIVNLDPRAQYPLFSAARIYTIVPSPPKILIMTEFIKENFLRDPSLRWEWMATATTLLKQDVGDLELALEYAKLLREHTKDDPDVPGWAKQMEAFMLSHNNKFDESAALFLKLLDSGEVTDPQEFLFLYDKLEETFRKMVESGQVTNQEKYEEMERTFEKVRTKYLEKYE